MLPDSGLSRRHFLAAGGAAAAVAMTAKSYARVIGAKRDAHQRIISKCPHPL